MEARSCPHCGRTFPAERLGRDLGGSCPGCMARALFDHFEESAAPAFEAGASFRDIEILDVIGRGGMGIVYKARQTGLDRIVALKVLSPTLSSNDTFCRRFEREARILASLTHPNIVQVHDFGMEGDIPFLVMEYVDGPTLQDRFESDPLALHRLIEIVRDVSAGLACIHEAGPVHRDIKPSNILLARDGTAKISDFGLAVESGDPVQLTETGLFIGSPAYVSPEHIRGETLDGRADLYSLGVILFQGLAGRLPFTGSGTADILARQSNDPPPVEHIAGTAPGSVTRIVERLLSKKPEDRFPSAKSLTSKLESTLPEAKHYRPGVFATARARLAARTRRLFRTTGGRMAVAGVLLLIAVIAASTWTLVSEWNRSKRKDQFRKLMDFARRSYDAGDFNDAERQAVAARKLQTEGREAGFFLTRLAVRRYLERRGIPQLYHYKLGADPIPLPPENVDERNSREEAARALAGFQNSDLARGMLELLKSNWNSAATHMSGIPDRVPEAGDAALYSAIAYYHLEDFRMAQRELRRLGSIRDGVALRLMVEVLLGLALRSMLIHDNIQMQVHLNEAVTLATKHDTPEYRILYGRVMVEALGMDREKDQPWSSQIRTVLKLLEDVDDPEAVLVRARLESIRVHRETAGLSDAEITEMENAFAAALDASPESAVPYFHRGNLRVSIAHARGRTGRNSRSILESAVDDFERAFELNPRFLEAGLQSLKTQIGLTDLEERPLREQLEFHLNHRARIQELTRRFPDDAGGLHTEATVLTVIASYRRNLGQSPVGDFQTAIQLLEKAQRLRPRMINSAIFLGLITRELAICADEISPERLDLLEKSAQHYTRVIEAVNVYDEGYSGRARTRHWIADYRRGQGEDPVPDYEASLADYDKALQRNPKDSALYRDRGYTKSRLILYRKGLGEPIADETYLASLADYNAALKWNPKDVMAYWYRAKCRNNLLLERYARGKKPSMGDLRRVIQDCSQYLTVAPEDTECLNLRAQSWSNMGFGLYFRGDDAAEYFRPALADFERLLKISPNHPKALLGRGIARVALGRNKEGVPDLRRAKSLDARLTATANRWLNIAGEKP